MNASPDHGREFAVPQGKPIARSTSTSRRIASAVRELDGQALQRAIVDPTRARSRFEFDLGSVLETRRWGRQEPHLSFPWTEYEQWTLREPSGWWL